MSVRSLCLQIVLACPQSPVGARTAAWADIAAQLDVYQAHDGWVGPNTVLLTAGRK